jgi:alpha-L-fucosidase
MNYPDQTDVRARLEAIDAVIETGSWAAEWEKLRISPPEWYVQGKFGIFIHWGVYSVPAFANEWYSRNMYRPGTPEYTHHRLTYGDQREFGYKDFIPMFRAEKFDAAEWARVLSKSGARFVVPVAEHHDGFAMYGTALNRWNAAEMGPQRDVIGELADAVRAQGMAFGVSTHRAEHWFFFNGGRTFPSDVDAPETLDLYGPAAPEELQPSAAFLEDWLVRTCELVDLQQPDIVYFDWWIEQPAFGPYLRRFAAYYYTRAEQWGRTVAINYKYGAFPEGTAVFDVERGQLASIRPHFWQTDTSVSTTSWSYVEPQHWKDPVDLICDLVDIVSKNGALMLNIGPKADGTIPAEEVRLLEAVGSWLATNGEAVYGTRPWVIPGEGPTAVAEGAFTDTERQPYTDRDIRFTTARGDIYATVLGPVTGSEVRIRSFSSELTLLSSGIERVDLAGPWRPEIVYRQDAEGLHIRVPDGAQRDVPLCFRVRPQRSSDWRHTDQLLADVVGSIDKPATAPESVAY